MEKLVYLLRDDAARPGSDLREALISKAAPAIRAAGGSDIIVNVQDDEVAAGQPIRKQGRTPIRAVVCFWMQCADDREPCEAALRDTCQEIDGYLVAESRPMVHERKPGGRSPGMNQITCVARKPGMSDEEFFFIWHGDHKVVAQETQSTTGYVRNVVTRTLTEGAPRFDGIVEETFPIERAHGSEGLLRRGQATTPSLEKNVGIMMESCHRFLDFEPMEVHPHVRVLRWASNAIAGALHVKDHVPDRPVNR